MIELHKYKVLWIGASLPLTAIDLWFTPSSTMHLIFLTCLIPIQASILINYALHKIWGKTFHAILFYFVAAVIAGYSIIHTVLSPGYTSYILTLWFTMFGLIVFERETKLPVRIAFFTATLFIFGYNFYFFPPNALTSLSAAPNHLDQLITGLYLMASISFVWFISKKYYEITQNNLMEHGKKINFQKNMFNILTHNIRTPLAALDGQIELAMLKGQSEIPLTAIQPSIDHLLRITHDLLDHNKVLKQEKALRIKELKKEIERHYEGRIQIETQIIKDKRVSYSTVLILQNFIDNALKYATLPKLRLHSDGENVAFIVEDNGPGFSPEHLESYGSLGKKPSMKGLGIGVFLSLSLIDHLSMKASVMSNQGSGSLVYISSDGEYQRPTTHFELERELI